MDARIEHIFNEEMKNDTSFKDKEGLFFRKKYTQDDMLQAWNSGIKHGIEIGLRRGSLEGQIIELNSHIENELHAEFLHKMYSLFSDYKCAIQYHPEKGMVVVDKKTITKNNYENRK